MASTVIHMCVANEINKIIKMDNRQILLGSIAPDISKHIGKTKKESHFLIGETDIPDMEAFINKYKNNLTDPFVLGYYIHLYTDYFWFKYFINEFVKKDYIYKLDGTKLSLTAKEKSEYIYNEYTNLNIKLIDYYKLELSLFYEELPQIKEIITEIPMDKINIIVKEAGIIITQSKNKKLYVFDIEEINKFIDLSINAIITNLKDLKII